MFTKRFTPPLTLYINHQPHPSRAVYHNPPSPTTYISPNTPSRSVYYRPLPPILSLKLRSRYGARNQFQEPSLELRRQATA
jgi:hypothetical protein